MHRFHLPPEQCVGPTLTLSDREAHHGLHVLRLRRGDQVTVLDGAGGEFLCSAADHGRHDLRLNVIEKRFIPPLPWRITLLQAIPKGKLFDTILQKATELGAHRIVPLLTERVVTQLDEDKTESKTEHWRAVVIEAIKQSGSAWLPEVTAPMTPAQFIECGERFDLPLIGSLRADARHPREWFRAFASEHGRAPQTLCVWVGPEGDFMPAELDAAQAAGARPITLGRLVLRCDTAAISCLSVMQYEMQVTVQPTA
jgi:16S rRNA (uracil1498-N3)-methyltransferase